MPNHLALGLANDFEALLVSLLNQAIHRRDYRAVSSLAEVANQLAEVIRHSEKLGDLIATLPPDYQAVLVAEELLREDLHVKVTDFRSRITVRGTHDIEDKAEISQLLTPKDPVAEETLMSVGEDSAERVSEEDQAEPIVSNWWVSLTGREQGQERSKAVHNYLDRGITDALTIATELTEKGIPTTARAVGAIKSQRTSRRTPPKKSPNQPLVIMEGEDGSGSPVLELPPMTGDELRQWRRQRIVEFYRLGIYETKDLLPRLLKLGDRTVTVPKVGVLKSFLPNESLEEARQRAWRLEGDPLVTFEPEEVADVLGLQMQIREDYRAAIKLLREEKRITDYDQVKEALVTHFPNLPQVSGNVVRGLWQIENHQGPFTPRS